MPRRIHTKRIYAGADEGDGRRILIDRLWPRGFSQERASIDYWARDVAPSDELRKWYRHDHKKWDQFCSRYFEELDANPEGLAELKREMGKGRVTLVFASVEEERNNAAAMKLYLERGGKA